MAVQPLTEDEVTQILAAPKFIRGDLTWRYDPNEGWAKGEIDVANKLKVDLKVYASANLRIPGRFSFNLTVSRAFSIRRLDTQKSHRNRHTDDRLMAGTHWHIWTNRCRDRWATDLPFPLSDSVDYAFESFARKARNIF